jgi:hypothetical protein
MSFHGGMAISLFGRAHDELSHVLVHPREFEQCPQFWFPTRQSQMLDCRDGRSLDARDCRIELAKIPFIQVRGFLPLGLSARDMDYASYVRQVNAVLGAAPAPLELITSLCRVRIGDVADFTLPNTEFALYQLMAEWQRDAREGAGPHGVGPNHRGWMTARMFEYPDKYDPNPVARFLEIYDQTFRTSGERSDSMALMIDPAPSEPARSKLNVDAFAQWKARLQNALHNRLHPALADCFGAPLKPVRVRALVGRKTGNRVVFGLRLDPSEIVIRRETSAMEYIT